ncbi:MAG: hypothetical protein WBB01_14150 [Phormidesmis sp.]
MKPSYLLIAEPLSGSLQPDSSALQIAPQRDSSGLPSKDHIRHILLGSPGAIRQTIHLLHTLRYAETALWTPVVTLDEPLTLPSMPGEAMSLLRKPT